MNWKLLMAVRDTHCSYCGQRYIMQETYPKKCQMCGNSVYLSSPAVGVGLVQINDGLLVVQRAIEPFSGQWAFPSGYKNIDESWEAGIAREVKEETGIVVDVSRIELMDAKTASSGAVLLFGLCDMLRINEPKFTFDEETSDALIVRESTPLCFPLHQEIMDWYFRTRI